MGRMILGRAIKHTITIKPSSNMGFLVHIGCGMFVADSKISLIAQLDRYLDNPEMYEREYTKECGREAPEAIREPDISDLEAARQDLNEAIRSDVVESGPTDKHE